MFHVTWYRPCWLALATFLVLFQAEGLADSPARKIPPLDKRIGQLFLYGIPSSRLDPKTLAHLKRHPPSGYVLFRRNLVSNKQTAELTHALQKLSLSQTGSIAFIAIDQEGGAVYRLPFDPPMPSPLALGQSGNPDLVEKLGHQVGKALRYLGFNMNLAPVLDLGASREYSFLGTRTFASEPDAVASAGTAFGRGLLAEKVIPVAKHFPGLGSITNDPHVSLVRRSVPKDQIISKDLVPFRNFAALSPSGIMLSHLIYPGLDPSLKPATYSRSIVNDLLLQEMDFKGLVLTDDLMMEGSKSSRDFRERVIQAFQAGADLIMISWSRTKQRQGARALLEAIEKGILSREDVLARIEKVERIKSELGPYRPAVAYDHRQLLVYGMKNYKKCVDQIFHENFKAQAEKIAELDLSHVEKFYLLHRQRRFGRRLQRQKVKGRKVLILPKNHHLTGENLEGTLLVFVRTSADARYALGLPTEVQQKTLVINQWRPFRGPKTAFHEFQIFMDHKDFYRAFGDWLNGLSRPSELPLADVRSPAESSPSPDPRETPRPIATPGPSAHLEPSSRPPVLWKSLPPPAQ